MALSKLSIFHPQEDLIALTNRSLASYVEDTLPFSMILKELQSLGLFQQNEPLDYSMEEWIQTKMKASLPVLSQTTFQLLFKPLEIDPFQDKEKEITSPKINCYIALLCDVLENQLAQKFYEELKDRESVTEQVHGLQAGKISASLNLPLSDILGLLFHDIARPSIDDPSYGHHNHCEEASIILAPLGLNTDYARYHAFAKYLLFKCCPLYQDLISPTSRATLEIQEKTLFSSLDELQNLDNQKLAETLYLLMFMRLIDDMSKVPLKNDPGYFTQKQIKIMLTRQILRTCNTTSALDNQLDQALHLLLRAQPYTRNPDLYKEYANILIPYTAELSYWGLH